METVIITGVSGAGKTQAIDYLEDFGYFCVDNMPLALLPKFLELCVEAGQSKVAVVTDIRSIIFDKEQGAREKINSLKIDSGAKVLFLDAEDSILVRRYQQTRRRHPFTHLEGSLERALGREREIIDPLKEISDIVIDTSDLKPANLLDKLTEKFDEFQKPDEMQLNIISFGFKYGIPQSADFVFDARFLPNPFYIDELKLKTGEDKEVRDYVMSSSVSTEYLKYIVDLLEITIPYYIKIDKTHLTIAFGCTGGQHRSVTFAYLLAQEFKEKGYSVSLEHRDILLDRSMR